MVIEFKINNEKQFQNIMENASNDKLVNIFKKLNGDDKNHYERLLQYYNQLIQSTDE
jgi:rubrerythrin